MRYRKKPIEVDAFRLTGDVDISVLRWFMKAVDAGRIQRRCGRRNSGSHRRKDDGRTGRKNRRNGKVTFVSFS